MKVTLTKIKDFHSSKGLVKYLVTGTPEALEAFKAFKGDFCRVEENGDVTTISKFACISGEMTQGADNKWFDDTAELDHLMSIARAQSCSLAVAREIMALYPEA